MEPRSAEDLENWLVSRMGPARAEGAGQRRKEANHLAARFPGVHRLGKHPDWRMVFEEGRLRATVPDSKPLVLEAADWGPAVYLFLGATAYPDGPLALLVDRPTTCTATPCDTGALGAHFRLVEPGPFGVTEIRTFLANVLFAAADVPRIAGAWISAHFPEDPRAYVTAPQKARCASEPVLHGLACADHDRRLWTIEIQVHDDLPISPATVRRVVVEDKDRYDQLPTAWQRHAVLMAGFGEGEETMTERIAAEILEMGRHDA